MNEVVAIYGLEMQFRAGEIVAIRFDGSELMRGMEEMRNRSSPPPSSPDRPENFSILEKT